MSNRFKSTKSAYASVKSTFRSFMSSVSQTLPGLKTLSSNGTPGPSVIPSHAQHVITYTESLQAQIEIHGIEQVRGWKVVKVDCRKAKRVTGHVSMLAYVNSPTREVFYLLFERAGVEIPHQSAPDILQTSVDTSASSSSSVSDSNSLDNRAKDTVSPLNDAKLRDEVLVGTLTFDVNDLPSILDVALLAGVVHKKYPSYQLISRNCYQYTASILSVLQKVHGGIMDFDADVAGKFCGLILPPTGDVDDLCILLEDEIRNVEKVVGLKEENVELAKQVEFLKAQLANQDTSTTND